MQNVKLTVLGRTSNEITTVVVIRNKLLDN